MINLKPGKYNRNQMIGVWSKDDFNQIMHVIDTMSEDDPNEKNYLKIRRILLDYSYFDKTNEEFRISIYPSDLGFLMDVVLQFSMMDIKSSNINDEFERLIEVGEVKEWFSEVK